MSSPVDRPNLSIAQQEHDALADTLRKSGAEVIYHDEYQPDHADAIFAFDPSLVTDAGAIILSMGKEKRRGEEAAMARTYEKLGIPILATLHGEARAEGGDLCAEPGLLCRRVSGKRLKPHRVDQGEVDAEYHHGEKPAALETKQPAGRNHQPALSGVVTAAAGGSR